MKNLEINQIKKNISELKYNEINIRTDNGETSLKTQTEDLKLLLHLNLWKKTSGEQWGNCAGYEVSIFAGTKFIYMNIISLYKHNPWYNHNMQIDTKSFLVFSEKLINIEKSSLTGDEKQIEIRNYVPTFFYNYFEIL